ncbi:unnamed protein product [Boreogadus saida]
MSKPYGGSFEGILGAVEAAAQPPKRPHRDDRHPALFIPIKTLMHRLVGGNLHAAAPPGPRPIAYAGLTTNNNKQTFPQLTPSNLALTFPRPNPWRGWTNAPEGLCATRGN